MLSLYSESGHRHIAYLPLGRGPLGTGVGTDSCFTASPGGGGDGGGGAGGSGSPSSSHGATSGRLATRSFRKSNCFSP